MNEIINVNEQSLVQFTKNGEAKTLYIYYLLSYITAGLGYYDLKDLYNEVYEITGTSKKTFKRWLELVREKGFIRVRKGTVYVKSKKRLGLNLNNTFIQFSISNLQSYKDFQKHTIQQIAVLTQKRFKYAYKLLSKTDAASLERSGKIETALAALRSANQAGCSISQLVKRLGLDKKTISSALKGVTEKQVNYGVKINGKTARAKRGGLITAIAGQKVPGSTKRKNKESRYTSKLTFKYDQKNDTYQFGCSIASKINVIPCLKRKKCVPGTTAIVHTHHSLPSSVNL